MKRILALCLLLPLLAGAASAKELKIPADNPVAKVNLPAGWTSDETDNGISCQSKDKEATIFLEVAANKEMKALINENVKFLQEQKVQLDQSTKHEGTFQANGMTVSGVEWEGKDESGDEHIQMLFIDIAPGKVLMVTYWVTKAAEKQHSAEIDTLLDSLKKI